MDELERRLRSALTEMADEVPASRDAWGEHERRMARRGRQARRRPFLMAAAAAAVVALILVPVLVLNNRGGDGVTAAKPAETSTTPNTSPSNTTKSPSAGLIPQSNGVYHPVAGEAVIIQPVVLMGEANHNVYGFVLNVNGATMFCTGEGPQITRSTSQAEQEVTKRICAVAKAPKPGKVFWGKFEVPADSNGLAAYAFLAAKPTHHIVVRSGNGTYSSASKLGEGPDFDLFFTATFGTGKEITNYTAKDAAGQTLEDA
jgi:hypothetical protein